LTLLVAMVDTVEDNLIHHIQKPCCIRKGGGRAHTHTHTHVSALVGWLGGCWVAGVLVVGPILGLRASLGQSHPLPTSSTHCHSRVSVAWIVAVYRLPVLTHFPARPTDPTNTDVGCRCVWVGAQAFFHSVFTMSGQVINSQSNRVGKSVNGKAPAARLSNRYCQQLIVPPFLPPPSPLLPDLCLCQRVHTGGCRCVRACV
jgi:hypothetical protein